MAYYKLFNIADFQQAHEQWLVSHREQYPNDLITIKYCEPLQVGSFLFIPATEVTEQWNIGELVGDIHEWHQLEMTIQVIMSYEDNLRMLNEYPELAVYCKENNIERHVENGFVYIYANFLLEEHETILKQFNAVINEGNI